MLKSFDSFQKNFNLVDPDVRQKAVDTRRIAAATYFTGHACSVIDSTKSKSDRRTKLQGALSELAQWRASEEQLDAVLRTAVEKNMRV